MSRRPRVLALTPPPTSTASFAPPRALPLGRVAMACADELVLGFASAPPDGASSSADIVVSVVDGPTSWTRRTWRADEVDAVYDRFPSQRSPAPYARWREVLAGVVAWGNDPATIELCRDKLATQRALEAAGVAMPEVYAVDSWHALGRFDAAYVKPRFGAFGVGVHRVVRGEEVNAAEVRVDGGLQPTIVQRAVDAPTLVLDGERVAPGALALRVLVQRGATAGSGFRAREPVARLALDGAVASVRGGASARAFVDVAGATLGAARGAEVVAEVRALAVRAAEAVVAAEWGDGERGRCVVELGVDVVVDRQWRPWVIEVNSKPQGHLRALAQADGARFGAAHGEARAAAVRALAALALG